MPESPCHVCGDPECRRIDHQCAPMPERVEPSDEGERCPTCGTDDREEHFALLDRGRSFDAGISGCPDPFHDPPPEEVRETSERWTITYDHERGKLVTDKPFPVTGPVEVVPLAHLRLVEEERDEEHREVERLVRTVNRIAGEAEQAEAHLQAAEAEVEREMWAKADFLARAEAAESRIEELEGALQWVADHIKPEPSVIAEARRLVDGVLRSNPPSTGEGK